MSKGEKSPVVIILDYKMGNLFSVHHAFKSLGFETIISSEKAKVVEADAIIIPGVGSFGDAMKNLGNLDLISPLQEHYNSDRPILGICLGMQLLFDESEEFGKNKGLGFIKGSILRFPQEHLGAKLRIPHIGWNTIFHQDENKWENSPFASVSMHSHMYFVHSYYAAPLDNYDIHSLTDYNGFEYCSSVSKGAIFATQFHPEKSSINGIKILKDWCDIYLNGNERRT